MLCEALEHAVVVFAGVLLGNRVLKADKLLSVLLDLSELFLVCEKHYKFEANL